MLMPVTRSRKEQVDVLGSSTVQSRRACPLAQPLGDLGAGPLSSEMTGRGRAP